MAKAKAKANAKPAARSTEKPKAAGRSRSRGTDAQVSTASAGDITPQGAAPQVVMTVSHDDIARKAYEIWLAKGRPMGQDEQNWREAEAALR